MPRRTTCDPSERERPHVRSDEGHRALGAQDTTRAPLDLLDEPERLCVPPELD